MFELRNSDKANCKELLRLVADANIKNKDKNPGKVLFSLADLGTGYSESEKKLFDFIKAQSYETLRKMSALMEYGRDGYGNTSIDAIYEGQGEDLAKSQEGIADYISGKSPDALQSYFEKAESFFE